MQTDVTDHDRIKNRMEVKEWGVFAEDCRFWQVRF